MLQKFRIPYLKYYESTWNLRIFESIISKLLKA